MKKVQALQDGDGHWYVVPNEVSTQFYSILEECSKKDDFEWFENSFGRYRTGGDLNLIQLFAEM